jgi:uncharacterized membrane protein
MTVFVLLLSIFVIVYFLQRLRWINKSSAREMGRVAMAITFIITGLLHFVAPATYFLMMPRFIPFPLALIYVSGVLEIAGGALLLVKPQARKAAYGIAILLLLIFPANIYVAIENVQLGGYMNSSLYQWARLPFQFLLIWWALWCSKPTENTQ